MAAGHEVVFGRDHAGLDQLDEPATFALLYAPGDAAVFRLGQEASVDVGVLCLAGHLHGHDKAFAPRDGGGFCMPTWTGRIALALQAVKGPVFAFEAGATALAKGVFLQRCKHTGLLKKKRPSRNLGVLRKV